MALDTRRNAAIDRDVRDDRLQFILRQTVAKRAAEMQLPFMHPVERRDHRDIDDAAGARVERLVAPARTPAIFSNELLKFLRECARLPQGFIDLAFPYPLTPLRQAFLKPFLVQPRLLILFKI